MPVQTSSPTISGGNNQLVSGTARNTWNSNKRLIAKLIMSEIIQNMNPLYAALPAVYNTLGSERFVKGLATTINIPLLLLGYPPLSETTINEVVNNLGGAAKVAQAIEEVNSGFQAPNLGYLYSFKQDELNIPSGEYTIGSIWNSDNQAYILQPSREWISSVDWIAGVPNLSWLGDWHEYDTVTSSFDEFAVKGAQIEPSYYEETPPGYIGGGESKEQNLLPLIGGAIGFLVGGPIGLPIGFIAGNFLGKK